MAPRRLSKGQERLVGGLVVAVLLAGLVVLVLSLPGEPDWGAAWERRGLFVRGLGITAVIAVGALLVALPLGTLAGVARVSRSIVVRTVAASYVEIVRGTPFLVQLYIWYWCIARLSNAPRDWFGSREALVVGTVGLAVFAGAYVAEIVRAAVESIDRGQWEAARSLGLSHRRTLLKVILPQCVRRMLPPLTGEAVSVVKESSLLSIIGVAEVTYHAKTMQAGTFETFAAFLPLAGLYLCLTLPLSLLTRRMEKRIEGSRPLGVAHL